MRREGMVIELKRCWNTTNPLYIRYHDEEWGVPLHDDNKIFEFLVLEGFQAGLSWRLILERREAFMQAFNGFDPKKVASYTESHIESLMNNPNVVRNRSKILAAVTNAKKFIEIQKEFGTFDNYIWQFVDGKPINNSFQELADLPAKTKISETISRELKKRGFQYVGPTICYAFMQAIGLVNDHLTSCFRYEEIRKLGQCENKSLQLMRDNKDQLRKVESERA
jgi:DNA-3-methyladenine glycosylase I